jgi:hypothetical protein
MTVSTGQGELQQLVHLVLQGAEANERPDLVRRMRLAADAVAAAPPAAAEAASIAATIVGALKSLEIDLRARRAALCDPARGARLAAEAQHAEARFRRFEDRAAKWPRMLGDALSAMDSDLEYGVQDRLRALLDEGTAVIESRAVTPADLEAWLRGRLITEVEVGQRELRSAAGEMAARLAGALELTTPLPPVTLALAPPEEVVAQLRRGAAAVSEQPPLSTRLLGIIMPTYSGMMIALVMPRLFGLELPVWLIGGVAVAGAFVMGGAAFSGERQRQRSRRNAENAGTLRASVEAFRMALGKQVRDGIRSVDQQVHAAVGEAVARQTRRLSGAAEGSRRSADDSGRTEQGRADIDLDLESVRELRQRAELLIAGG